MCSVSEVKALYPGSEVTGSCEPHSCPQSEHQALLTAEPPLRSHCNSLNVRTFLFLFSLTVLGIKFSVFASLESSFTSEPHLLLLAFLSKDL